MAATIEVQPNRTVRREFAQWVNGYSVRTLGPSSFAVGADLFPQIPEELLAGATVEGQPWVTPDRSSSATPSSGKRGSPRTKEK